MTATERLMQEQVDMLVRDFAQMRERAERAEAALRTALDYKKIFRICWEKAEAELAAVPIDALRQIAEREQRLLPVTPQRAALNAWLETLPSDNDLASDA